MPLPLRFTPWTRHESETFGEQNGFYAACAGPFFVLRLAIETRVTSALPSRKLQPPISVPRRMSGGARGTGEASDVRDGDTLRACWPRRQGHRLRRRHCPDPLP